MAIKAMQNLPFLFLLFLLIVSSVHGDDYGDNYGGSSWQTAHATFYGGADASGTMGKLKLIFTKR